MEPAVSDSGLSDQDVVFCEEGIWKRVHHRACEGLCALSKRQEGAVLLETSWKLPEDTVGALGECHPACCGLLTEVNGFD